MPNRDIAVRLASPGIAESQAGMGYMPMLGNDGHVETLITPEPRSLELWKTGEHLQ